MRISDWSSDVCSSDLIIPCCQQAPMKGQRFRARLSFAIRGIAIAWRRERSFRAQSGGAVAVLLTLTILRPGLLWTAAALTVIALVLALALMNAGRAYLNDHSPDRKRVVEGKRGVLRVDN